MDRSKLIAITTGVISLILAIAYLLLVFFLDFRGEMKPAPPSQGIATTTTLQQMIAMAGTREYHFRHHLEV